MDVIAGVIRPLRTLTRPAALRADYPRVADFTPATRLRAIRVRKRGVVDPSRNGTVARVASSRASHAELRNPRLRFCFSRLASHTRIRTKSAPDHCAGTRIRAKSDTSAGITGHTKRRNSNEKRTHPDHDLPVVHRRHSVRPNRKP